MRVIWSPTKHQANHAIASYADAGDIAAARFADALDRTVASLAQFPRSGREGAIVGTRERVIAKYRWVIDYAVRAQHVAILWLIPPHAKHPMPSF